MNELKTLVVDSSVRINGYIVGFADGNGTWFYTPDEPPEGTEEKVTAGHIHRKSHNFPTKQQAIAFGLGFENEMEGRL